MKDELQKEIYTDFKEIVSRLAESLGVASEHVYSVLVKQQIVEAIIYLIPGIVLFFAMKQFLKSLKNGGEKSVEKETYSGEREVWKNQDVVKCILFGALTLISLLVFSTHIDTVVSGFINPEYGAMKEILDKFN